MRPSPATACALAQALGIGPDLDEPAAPEPVALGGLRPGAPRPHRPGRLDPVGRHRQSRVRLAVEHLHAGHHRHRGRPPERDPGHPRVHRRGHDPRRRRRDRVRPLHLGDGAAEAPACSPQRLGGARRHPVHRPRLRRLHRPRRRPRVGVLALRRRDRPVGARRALCGQSDRAGALPGTRSPTGKGPRRSGCRRRTPSAG